MRRLKKYLLVLIICIVTFSTVSISVGAISEKQVNEDYTLLNIMPYGYASGKEYKSIVSSACKKVKEKMSTYSNSESFKSKKAATENINKLTTATCDGITNLVKTCKNKKIGEDDCDVNGIFNSLCDLGAGIAACCGPWGLAISAGIKVVQTAVNLIVGGEDPAGAEAILGEQITGQFDEVKNNISDLQKQNSALANQLTDATSEILSKLETEIELQTAKQHYDDFAYRGTGNFSYNEMKEVLFGESRLQKAYAQKLAYAYANDESEETIKRYQDYLYNEIITNIDVFYDYVCIDENNASKKSIIEEYYTMLSSSDNVSEEDALVYTILFAEDLLNTAVEMEQKIASCHYYQSIKMMNDYAKYPDTYLKGGDSVVYNGDFEYGVSVTLKTIYDNEENSKERLDKIESSVVIALSRILNLTDSYYVVNNHVTNDSTLLNQTLSSESTLPIMYRVENNDTDDEQTFGWVNKDDKVYVNEFPSEMYSLFDLTPDDFTYSVYNTVNNQTVKVECDDGIISIDNNGYYSVEMIYKNQSLGSYTLKVGNNTESFNGGYGTEEDPYIISSFSQLLMINDGLDKCYKLVSNINCNGNVINPIGYPSETSILSYEEFNGSFDGSNYTILNLGISNYCSDANECGAYTGLFAKIGYEGIVENLNIYYPDYNIIINDTSQTKNEFYAGIITAQNNGTINNCKIYDEYPEIEENDQEWFTKVNDPKSTDEMIEENLGLILKKYGTFKYYQSKETIAISVENYIGGICAENNGTVSYCSIDSVKIYGESTIDSGANATSDNENSLFISAAICTNNGYVDTLRVANNVTYGIAIHKSNSKNRVTPHLTTKIGGCFVTTVEDITHTKNIYYFNNKLYDYVEAKANKGMYREDKMVAKSNAKWIDYDASFTSCFVRSASDISYLLNSIKNSDRVYSGTYAYNNVSNLSINCEVGANLIDFENLLLKVNNITYTYKTDDATSNYTFLPVSIYGMRTINDSSTHTMIVDCTLLAVIFTNDNVANVTVTLILQVEKDSVVDFSIEGYDTEYDAGDSLMTTGYVAKATYKSGNVVTLEDLSDVIMSCEEGYSLDTLTSKQGKYDVTFSYLGFETTETINVTCDCDECTDYENSHFVKVEEECVAQTCFHGGYDIYQCTCCGLKYKTNTSNPCNHQEVEDPAVAATCETWGHTAGKHCSLCGTILEETEPIAPIDHVYESISDTKHKCTIANHEENHEFTITQKVVDGVCTYTYECAQCGYRKDIEDQNIITVKDRTQPTILITNGYAVNGGDIVKVYVQLLNNPGITIANFGIRYDNRLELVKYEEGILKDRSQDEGFFYGTEVDNGINFLWLFTEKEDAKTTLVTLYFRIPSNATLTDIYDVNLVYDLKDNGTLTGFSVLEPTDDNPLNRESKQFAVNAGEVRKVNHLPGDADGDGVVDIVDVIYMAKYINNDPSVSDDTTIGTNINKYCNVNLNRNDDDEAIVDTLDARLILLHVVGKVGEEGSELLSPTYRIKLVTNNDDEDIYYYWVDLNGDEENNFANKTFENLPDLLCERNGHTLVYWSSDVIGQKAIALTDNVNYNYTQKIQTLYANWTNNKIVFDLNGADSNGLEPVIYDDETSEDDFSFINLNYTKDVVMVLVDSEGNNEDYEFPVEFGIDSWYFGDVCVANSSNKYLSWNSPLFASDKTNPGTITVKIKWNTVNGYEDTGWTRTGYQTGFDWEYLDSSTNKYKTLNNINAVNDYSFYNVSTDRKEIVLRAKWNNPINYNISYNMNSHGHIDGLYHNNNLYYKVGSTIYAGYDYQTKYLTLEPFTTTYDLKGLKIGSTTSTVDLTAVLQNDDHCAYLYAVDGAGNRVTGIGLELYTNDDSQTITLNFDSDPYQGFAIELGENELFREYNIKITNTNTDKEITIKEFWVGDGSLMKPTFTQTTIENGLSTCISVPYSGYSGLYDPENSNNSLSADLYRNFVGYYVVENNQKILLYDEDGMLTQAGMNYVVDSDIELIAKWENKEFDVLLFTCPPAEHWYVTIADTYINNPTIFPFQTYPGKTFVGMYVSIYDEAGVTTISSTSRLYLTAKEILYMAAGYMCVCETCWDND